MKTCWKCDKPVSGQHTVCPHCQAPLSDEALASMASVTDGTAPQQIVVGVLVKNRYEIRELVGKGGMGVVYRAWDRVMEDEVALKVIPQEVCLDPSAIADLKRETSIALKLTHDHVVRLHTLDTWQGQAFVVMEYVNGGTLSHLRINRGGRLPLGEALPYLEQIAAAIDYAHHAVPPVIHRDLKALNILLTKDGRIKVADFSLARVMRDSVSRISGHAETAGTLPYMAPEQVRGKGIGRHTDLYALAAIAYELIGGRLPFHTGDLRWQILHEQPEPLPGLPEEVNAALLAGLAKDPAERPATAADFVRLLRGEQPAGAGPLRQTPVASGTLRRLVIAGVLLVSCAGLALAGYRYRDDLAALISSDAGNQEGPAATAPTAAAPQPEVQQDEVKVQPVLVAEPEPKPEPKPEPVAKTAEKPPFGKTFKDSVTGMTFVWVQGGCFLMGDVFEAGAADEKPTHEVCLDSYYMGRYEVTQGIYEKIVGTNPSGLKKGTLYPVERVSWNDAQEFIKKLNGRSGRTYRLPTEAEWEYAARNRGEKDKYAGGDRLETIAWFNDNSEGATHGVGTKKANPLGIDDLTGNVREWCADWYDNRYYQKSPGRNPAGPDSGTQRVVRGGGWLDSGRDLWTTARSRNEPGHRRDYLGFRLVLPLQ